MTRGALVIAVTCITAAPNAPPAHQPDSAEALRRQAFALAYSHQHEEAAALLRRAVTLDPGSSAAHRNLASVLWLQMLFRRGAVTVDHYLGSFSRARVDLPRPPAELDTEFRRHLARSIELAEAGVAAHSRDPQAHFDLGAVVGLQASYIATVEGKLLAGFKAARRAYDAHERVMALDPSRTDAGLIVGTYRYIVSTLSLPMRVMAYVAGFGGGRERGIRLIEETAASEADNRTDALFALVLVYNREKRYEDALRVLEELRALYPRNRLVLMEGGSTALRAERFEQAEALLSEGLARMPVDPSRRIPGEEALWRYKRGAAFVGLGRMDAALADLNVAATPSAQSWVQGRARVELARVALGQGRSEAAAAEARNAQSLCQKGNDPVCVDAAKKLLKKANGK